MNFVRHNRAVIALLLYSCVLFSSLACALGHGQNSGLLLSGINQLSCSISGASAPADGPAQPQLSPGYDCPICSGHALAPTNLHGWAIAALSGQPIATLSRTHQQLPASALWPDAPPRAPPVVS